jgi:hypothetical protein
MKFSQTVNKVLALAEAVRDYWNVELPKRHPDYPFVNEGDEDGPPPPEQKKLKKLLASLPEDSIYKIALIMRYNRGPSGKKCPTDNLEVVKQWYETPEEAAVLIADNAALADELSYGLEEMKIAGFDVDHLTLTPSIQAARTVKRRV